MGRGKSALQGFYRYKARQTQKVLSVEIEIKNNFVGVRTTVLWSCDRLHHILNFRRPRKETTKNNITFMISVCLSICLLHRSYICICKWKRNNSTHK